MSHAAISPDTALQGKHPKQLELLPLLYAIEKNGPHDDALSNVEELPIAEAEARLGRGNLAMLNRLGVIARLESGRVALPKGATLRTVHDEWLRQNPPQPTPSSIERVVKVRRACALPRNAAPADTVTRAAIDLLKLQMGTVRADELAALLNITTTSAKAAIRKLKPIKALNADDPLIHHRPMTMDEIVARVPQLADAPETCLDKNAREECKEPGKRSRSRLAGTGPLFPSAALFLLICSASARREQRLEHHMLMLQRFGTWFQSWNPNADLHEQCAITETLERIAFSDELEGVVSEGVRDMVCRSMLMLVEVTTRYARSMDPDGSRGLEKLIPAGHKDTACFRRRLLDQFRHLRAEARERRKLASDPLADELSVKSGAFWERMEQLGEIAAKGRDAAEALIAQAYGASPYVEFLVPVAVLDDNGRHIAGHPEGHLQEERWRVWREADLRRSLGLPLASLTQQDQLRLPCTDGETSSDNFARSSIDTTTAHRSRVYFERLGARAILGHRVIKPFFATLSDCGVLVPPGGLDRRMIRRRGTILRTWHVPRPSSLPEGLLWFDRSGDELWRHASARGRSLIPLMEFETAAMFAELGCNAVLESMCRGNAFMQMEDNADAWPLDESEAKHAGLCFAAIEKTPADADPVFVHLPVLDQTLLDARELASRVVEAVGATDGIVPDVLIEPRYRWKRPFPRPFIFQWNGQALTLSAVNHILRLVFANIADASFHDFRHACAADLYDSCRWPSIVQRALGQTSGVWRHYAKPTARMRRRDQMRREQERRQRAAKRDWERTNAA